MPELPEVETIKNDLEREISGFEVIKLWFDEPKLLKPSPELVKKNVIGEKIKGVRRRAKLIIINFSKDSLLIHLKLTGRLLIRDLKDPQDDWIHVIFTLKRGKKIKELRFSNLRKFGYIKLVDKKQLKEIFKEFGPEFFRNLDLRSLKTIIKKSGQKIKQVLMDQKKIAGIGNIYANEALFKAKIHPETKANKLSVEQMTNLYKALEYVLKEGIKYRGSSGGDEMYRDAHGEKGHYQEHFKVYQRKGEPCLKCGSSIKMIKVGGRGTFFCPKCQKRSWFSSTKVYQSVI